MTGTTAVPTSVVNSDDPHDVQTKMNILAMYADSLVDGGQFAKAVLVYRFLADRIKRDVRWQVGLGYCLVCDNKFDEAIDVLNAVSKERLNEDLAQAVDLLVEMCRNKSTRAVNTSTQAGRSLLTDVFKTTTE